MRDYGTGAWEGGSSECDHKMPATGGNPEQGPNKGNNNFEAMPFKDVCGKCGATRIDQQLGLEPTPEEYVTRMVEVFREVRRVLAPHGTVWLNLGDSYASAWACDRRNVVGAGSLEHGKREDRPNRLVGGLKEKDLCGIPWRVAFALQADGWCLRSDIVWAKPNPMPESVTDRPTKAHEMVFLLSKATWKGPERGRYADISDEDARWLALLFDTEGNIVVKKAKNGDRTQYGAQMAFANTNRHLLERAQALVGDGAILERPGTNAPMFYWQMSGREARDLLYRIYPHLIVKQRQAAVAIHMQDVVAEPKKRPGGYRTDEHTAFLDRCWETVKSLNQFGDPDLSWVPIPRYGRWVPNKYFFDQEAVREDFEARPQQRLTANIDMPLGPARVAAGVQQGNPQGGTHRSRFDINGQERIDYLMECLYCGCAQISAGPCYACGREVAPIGPEPERGLDGRRKTSVQGADGSIQHRDGERWPNGGRNIRSVWEIATQPYPEAHFATFPEELARRCIAAGTSERGKCPECGAPWVREVEVTKGSEPRTTPSFANHHGQGRDGRDGSRKWIERAETLGWRPTCECGPYFHKDGERTKTLSPKPTPCVVLDPFIGSGTVAHVARKLGRHAVGIDLNESYLELAARRLQQQSLFAEVASGP